MAGDEPLTQAPGGPFWPAPAKLNLFLRVVGRRPDGYHELQTVFQMLDHGDLLAFEASDGLAVARAYDLPGVPAERDLVLRAARLLQARTGCQLGVRIRLHKRLPMGGGLGGGSSDAATTLVALNHIWGCGLQAAELAELGLALGADVPVFVHGHAAWAEGVGERLMPVDLQEPWYLVIWPPVDVSTATVFADPELTRDLAPITLRDFISGEHGNACEPVVRRRYPEVGRAMGWLDRFASARLTGTGGCVFATFDEPAPARAILRRLPEPWHGFVARGRNRSPLVDKLRALEDAS